MRSLRIIKAQVEATSNMLHEFGKLNAQGLDVEYHTKELDLARGAIKKALITLTDEMKSHKDYDWTEEVWDRIGE